MIQLINRAKVSTATIGTGDVDLGAAVITFQTWAAAGAVSGRTYSYLIEEGNDWEIGEGVFTDAATDTLTRTLIASSTGALLALAGAATVACVAKARDIMAREPTLVQQVVNRGGGAFALPVAPTVGNLMVMFASGFTSISAYALAGFIQIGNFSNGVNNHVRCWARRVQAGDTGAYVVAATTDKQGILYEFADAGWVASVNGGSTGWSGTNFLVENPVHAFAQNGQQLFAAETDNASVLAITAETGWTLDYATPGGTAGNHYAAMGRQAYPHDGTVAGTASAAVLTPIWGSFVVTAAPQ